jgi:hypothetical protein
MSVATGIETATENVSLTAIAMRVALSLIDQESEAQIARVTTVRVVDNGTANLMTP